MSSEEKKNKALVRRFVEAQAEKDLAALEEMLAPDFVDHSVLPGQGTTREDYLQDVAEEQPASSDAQLSIEDQMAEDDRVMTRLVIHGSHDQEIFTGVPPTGVLLKFTGIIINRVVGGKIVEEWSEGTLMRTSSRSSVSIMSYASASASSRSCWWRGASSRPHF